MTDQVIIDMFAKKNEQDDKRFNSIESKVDFMCGYLKSVVESNEKLIGLFTKALRIIAFISIISVGAVVYGAIGHDGFKAVREIFPDMSCIVPDNHDTDVWQNGGAA